MKRVFIHPFVGVLSAYGMGLADTVAIREKAVEAELTRDLIADFGTTLAELETDGRAELAAQNVDDAAIRIVNTVHLKYQGTDTALSVDFGNIDTITYAFETAIDAERGI